MIVSCYLLPSLTYGQYAAVLNYLESELLRFTQASVVVDGDFNAWIEEWGLDHKNRRGTMLRSPTYQSGVSRSVIDFTFLRMIAPLRVDG